MTDKTQVDVTFANGETTTYYVPEYYPYVRGGIAKSIGERGCVILDGSVNAATIINFAYVKSLRIRQCRG